MAKHETTKGKLRISAGAGEGFEVDAATAARYAGRPVNDALLGIINDEVHDPELRQMLMQPRLALDLYGRGDDGEFEEVPLSPEEDWDRVLRQLEEADAEVGIARSHTGGGRRFGRHRPADAARAADAGTPCFPRQEVVMHPAGYELTDADRADVQAGRAVFFTGPTIAKAEAICEELGGKEAIWYYVAPSDDTAVISGVLIPRQTVSAGFCKAPGKDVLAAARRARRQGWNIVASGHSHGNMGIFTSTTDQEQMAELARERVGRISVETTDSEGTVGPAHGADARGLEVTFPDNPGAAVFIEARQGATAELKPSDVAVRLRRTRRRSMSIFSTHNRKGDHLVPVLAVVSCPHCGATEEQHYLEPDEVRVHVIGPVEIDQEAREQLRKELDKKVRSHAWWQGDQYGGWDDEDVSAGPAPFQIYRRGRFLTKVSAAVMERAAAETAALAAALGWESREAGAETQDTQVQEQAAHD